LILITKVAEPVEASIR